MFGEVKEFRRKKCEFEKPILDLENGNRRIDVLDILILLCDVPKRNQIREILGYGY